MIFKPPINIEQNTRQNAKSQLPLEFYLGTALGFLLASLMLNASYGWLSGFYPIPVLAMLFAGFVVGKIRLRVWKTTIALQSFTYRLRFFLVVWLFCALGPYCGMKIHYWVQATSLPVPPDWTRTSVQTTVLGWDNGAGFHVRVEGHGEQKALQFYRQYFEEKGWSDHSGQWVVASSKSIEYVYGKANSQTRMRFGVLDKGYQPDQKRIIYLARME